MFCIGNKSDPFINKYWLAFPIQIVVIICTCDVKGILCRLFLCIVQWIKLYWKIRVKWFSFFQQHPCFCLQMVHVQRENKVTNYTLHIGSIKSNGGICKRWVIKYTVHKFVSTTPKEGENVPKCFVFHRCRIRILLRVTILEQSLRGSGRYIRLCS